MMPRTRKRKTAPNNNQSRYNLPGLIVIFTARPLNKYYNTSDLRDRSPLFHSCFCSSSLSVNVCHIIGVDGVETRSAACGLNLSGLKVQPQARSMQSTCYAY